MKRILLVIVLIYSIFFLREQYAFSYDKQEVKDVINETEKYLTKEFVDGYGPRFELYPDIIIDNNCLLDECGAYLKLQNITKKSWKKIISDIEFVAPTENAKTIFIQSAQSLKREEYIEFLLKLADKTKQGIVSHQQFKWALFPHAKHLRNMWSDDQDYARLPELVQKVKKVFANDKNKEQAKVIIKFFENILEKRKKDNLEYSYFSLKGYCEVEFLSSLRKGKDPITQLQILKEKISFDEKDKDFNKRMEFFLKGIRVIAQKAMIDEIKRKGELVEELLKLRKKLLETKPITYKKIVIDNVIRMLINGIAFQALDEKDDKSIKIIRKALIEFNKTNYYTPDLIARIFKKEMGLDIDTKGKSIYDIFEEYIIKKKILKNYDKNKPVFDNLVEEVSVNPKKLLTGLKEQLKEFNFYSFVHFYSYNDIVEYILQVGVEVYLKGIDIQGDVNYIDIVETIEELKTNIKIIDVFKTTMKDLMEFKKYKKRVNDGNNEKYKINQAEIDRTIYTLKMIKNGIKGESWEEIINYVIEYISTL